MKTKRTTRRYFKPGTPVTWVEPDFTPRTGIVHEDDRESDFIRVIPDKDPGRHPIHKDRFVVHETKPAPSQSPYPELPPGIPEPPEGYIYLGVCPFPENGEPLPGLALLLHPRSTLADWETNFNWSGALEEGHYAALKGSEADLKFRAERGAADAKPGHAWETGTVYQAGSVYHAVTVKGFSSPAELRAAGFTPEKGFTWTARVGAVQPKKGGDAKP